MITDDEIENLTDDLKLAMQDLRENGPNEDDVALALHIMSLLQVMIFELSGPWMEKPNDAA